MICLRCGYCCENYCVIIVDNPDKGLAKDNLICHDGKGPCKHLKGDVVGEYSCVVHNKPWYKKTPCFSHGQIERSKDTPCRIGEYILNQMKDVK